METQIATVRAKFQCLQNKDGQISLMAVQSGSKENEEFFSYTPSGQINIGTVNENAANQFEVGKEYYVDFTPAN